MRGLIFSTGRKEACLIPCHEKNDEAPICSHCQAPLESVSCRGLSSPFGRRYIYFCPNCRKTLGVSHRKGFWMG